LAAAVAPAARADETASAASPSSAASAALGVAAGPNPDAGVAVGGFLVYPAMFAGVVYNDNLYATQNDRKAALGLLFSPNLTAVDDQGLHKTTLTLNGDAEIYPSFSESSPSGPAPSNVSGVASVEHVWKPAEDWTVDITGAFGRQYGIFGSFVAAGSSFVSTPTLGVVTGYRQYSNQFNGSLSVEKKFDQWFLRGGFGVQDVQYEAAPVGVAGAQSGFDYNGFLRGGFWATPQLNVFVETGADLRQYRDSWYDADAYRVIAGLSSDLISLFRGEVYGGYQQQVSAHGRFGAVAAPAYGARIYYYPTPYFTIAASVDQTFGSAAAPTAPAARAPNSDTVQTRLQADYTLAEYWTASARAGYARTTWSSSPLIESEWTFGGGVSYTFWRNLGLGLNYQYTAVNANQAGVAAYSQNLVSAGMTYHY